jgi:hypothetical protein
MAARYGGATLGRHARLPRPLPPHPPRTRRRRRHVPGSKSITNRALLVAALARGRSTLTGALVADDAAVMVAPRRRSAPRAPRRRRPTTIDVVGVDGRWPSAGPTSTSRSRAPRCASSPPRSRSAAAASCSTASTACASARSATSSPPCGARGRHAGRRRRRLPAGRGRGRRPPRRHTRVAGDRSSQFLSGLLLAAPYAPGPSRHGDGVLQSKPFVDLTLDVMRAFGVEVERDGYDRFDVRPGAYVGRPSTTSRATRWRPATRGASPRWRAAACGSTTSAPLAQGDKASSTCWDDGLRRDLDRGVLDVSGARGRALRGGTFDLNDLPGPGADAGRARARRRRTRSRSCNVGNLRIKETDRLHALATELRQARGRGRGARRRARVVAARGARRRRSRSTPTATTAWRWRSRSWAVAGPASGARPRLRRQDLPGLLRRPAGVGGRGERRRDAPAAATAITLDGPAASGKSSVARGWRPRSACRASRRACCTARRRPWPPRRRRRRTTPRRLPCSIATTSSCCPGWRRRAADRRRRRDAPRAERRGRRRGLAGGRPPAGARLGRRRLREMPAPFVIDGRDMGSVVFPHASHKFYLDASPEVRAARRVGERSADLAPVAAAIRRRDALDARQLGPAPDAVHLDTGPLTLDEVVAWVLARLEPAARRGRRRPRDPRAGRHALGPSAREPAARRRDEHRLQARGARRRRGDRRGFAARAIASTSTSRACADRRGRLRPPTSWSRSAATGRCSPRAAARGARGRCSASTSASSASWRRSASTRCSPTPKGARTRRAWRSVAGAVLSVSARGEPPASLSTTSRSRRGHDAAGALPPRGRRRPRRRVPRRRRGREHAGRFDRLLALARGSRSSCPTCGPCS